MKVDLPRLAFLIEPVVDRVDVVVVFVKLVVHVTGGCCGMNEQSVGPRRTWYGSVPVIANGELASECRHDRKRVRRVALQDVSRMQHGVLFLLAVVPDKAFVKRLAIGASSEQLVVHAGDFVRRVYEGVVFIRVEVEVTHIGGIPGDWQRPAVGVLRIEWNSLGSDRLSV